MTALTPNHALDWRGALAALLGRYPDLADEPQLGAILHSEVACPWESPASEILAHTL